MKRALRAASFFCAVCGLAVFGFLLVLAGSGFRILTPAAAVAGFGCALATFSVSSSRFPVLLGMLSGSLALLGLPFGTYLVALVMEGELPLLLTPHVALLLSVPLLSGHGSSLVVVGAILGGGFARFSLIRARLG